MWRKHAITLVGILSIVLGIYLAVTKSQDQDEPAHQISRPDPLGPVAQPGTNGGSQWFSISGLPTDLLVQIWFDDIRSRPDPDEETQPVWVRVKDKTGKGPWVEARVRLRINCYRGTFEEIQASVVKSDLLGQLQGLTQVTPGKILPNSATDLVTGTICR